MPASPTSPAPRAAAGEARRGRRAFTLYELMCAVVVLAITATMAIPLFAGTADLTLAAAQRKLLSDLQYAQELAVAGRQSVYVRFSANRYDVCTLVNNALVVAKHPIDPGAYTVTFGSASATRSLRDVKLLLPSFGTSGNRTVGFDPTGTPFAFDESLLAKTALATRQEVTLNIGNTYRTVYLEAFTGELHVP